jgi:hypothetical protein
MPVIIDRFLSLSACQGLEPCSCAALPAAACKPGQDVRRFLETWGSSVSGWKTEKSTDERVARQMNYFPMNFFTHLFGFPNKLSKLRENDPAEANLEIFSPGRRALIE